MSSPWLIKLIPGNTKVQVWALAICKRLIHLMNGNITVESQQGVGSTFEFTIELQKTHEIAYPKSNRAKRDTTTFT